jgi:ASC-1-like (ASCH) protein
MIHESKLQSPYFEYVRDGIKIYETRVYDDKRKQINLNDYWVFSHNLDNSQKIKTKIIGIKIYSTFGEAIVDSGVEKLLPNVSDVSDAIRIYESFDNGNYKLDAEKYGVVRFTLELVLTG